MDPCSFNLLSLGLVLYIGKKTQCHIINYHDGRATLCWILEGKICEKERKAKINKN
jgi:hypothetical protein